MPSITRYYSSTAAKTTLAAAIDASTATVSITLAAASGLPNQYPYTLIIDKDTANEEIVEVSNLIGSTYTVVRGVDGTSPKSHSIGATVEHGVSGRDFAESRSHEAATSAHGVTGDVVGTGGAQTLTGKTLTTATLGSDLAAGGFKITNLATPTSSSDAATKAYIDTQTTSAAASASSAAVSASSAATSASSALTSQTSAATSSTSAAASATAAATSASSAATSATSAATSASSALTSQTSAATSATSAAASATAAATSASSALTSQTSAATSATSAAASATAAATSANSASTSATSAATSASSADASAVAAAASAASVDATATAATELRQYGAEGSILNNIPTRVHPAENLLRQAAYWIDSNHTSSSSQTVDNLGWTGDLLPTTLGSSTAADSNDPKFLDWTGTNYVYLPGVTTSFLSVPNDSPVQITGDIDVRQWVALDDWTPSSDNEVGSKTGGAGSRGWIFQVIPTGALRLIYSTDGTNLLTRTSTATISAADGSNLWVRFTLDVDNGAGGNDVKFFTSTDGTNWTQLGATITNAGTTSIFNTTAVVKDNGGSTSKAGKLYRFQIFASIDGTDKRLDIDTSVITSGAATSFYALSGQTVTINRSTSGRKTVAVVHPCWLFGTDDYMEVNNRYMSSGTYLYLPGVASNNCTTPDAAALDITGDIDLRVKVALDDWTPSATQYLVAKLQTQRSYGLQLNTDGRLVFVRSTDGSATTSVFSGVATVPFADGATGWVRVTFDVDNGAGGNDTIFYTSTDGTNWTQLGTTQTNAGTTATFNSNAPLEIGTGFAGVSGPARGKFFRAQVLNGIDGTVAFDANFESSITSLNQASFTESSANSATVTINRSGSAYRSAGITQAGYLYPGATNTFRASSVDYLNFGANDSFTVLGVVRNWATAPSGVVVAKKGDLGATAVGYALYNTSTVAAFRIAGPSGTSDVRAANISTGTLQSSIGIRNTVADTISLSYNSATVSVVDPTSSLSNFDAVRIGATPFGGYNDMELYAAAVFRRALTDAEIASIYTYYAGRVGA